MIFCDDILFKRYRDAANVLIDMLKILNNYHMVTIEDFYDLTGLEVPMNKELARKKGWTNLSEARIIRLSRDDRRYCIGLPEPKILPRINVYE